MPELKYREFKTTRLIKQTLRRYGYRPKQVGKTGVVALLDSGRPGPTIALRADIDALPIVEETGLPYSSQHPGVMHACGHDGHTATLLLVARILKERAHELRGVVKLIFQPAEEGGKGSTAMIKGGVLEDPPVDAIYGYHNWPGLPLGRVGVRKGPILAGSGRFEISLPRKTHHLAHTSPQDPLLLLAGVITDLSRIDHTSLISVEGPIGGDVKLIGIYHYASEGDLAALQARVKESLPVGADLQFFPFHLPTINAPKEADQVYQAAESPQWLEECMMVAEDFSEYLVHVPGCFFLVGAGEDAPAVHTARFDFDDRILPIAATVFIKLLTISHL